MGCPVPALHNCQLPDKLANRDFAFCNYNRIMFNSEGNRFPPGKTWQQKILKAASFADVSHEHPLYRLSTIGTRISPYSMAFLDCIGVPKLVNMDISHWTGEIGQWIHIQVLDKVRVLQVRVMIRENMMSDKVFESGHAYPSRLNPSIWTYVTKTKIHQVSGFCVDVLANDLPGNVSVETVEYT